MVAMPVVFAFKCYVAAYQVYLNILFPLFLEEFRNGERAVGAGHTINLPICLFHIANLLIRVFCGGTIIYTWLQIEMVSRKARKGNKTQKWLFVPYFLCVLCEKQPEKHPWEELYLRNGNNI